MGVNHTSRSLPFLFGGLVVILGLVWWGVTSWLDSDAPLVPIALVLDDPESYDGENVCVEGTFRSAGDFSAIADDVVDYGGSYALTGNVLWVSGDVPVGELTCDSGGICLGHMTLCGTINGRGSYGKGGLYVAQISL